MNFDQWMKQQGKQSAMDNASPGLILWGDGVHDDTAALQAFIDGEVVLSPDGSPISWFLASGVFRVSDTVWWTKPSGVHIGEFQIIGSEIPKDRPFVLSIDCETATGGFGHLVITPPMHLVVPSPYAETPEITTSEDTP